MNLPDALQRHLADSELIVTSWSAEANELSIRLEKDIGPETGRLAFQGVLQVNLPPTLTISGMEVHTPASVPNDFWNIGSPKRSELGDSDYGPKAMGKRA
jgi:hypothetical protein